MNYKGKETPSMENHGEIIIYQTADGQSSIEVKMLNDTVWLTLDLMADLFQRDQSTVSRHIKNVFKEGELYRDAVVANFATTASDGKTYQVDYYNLDVIISVGYRVKSQRGTQFRIWANRVLKEYLTKGYAINEKIRQENLLELRQLVQLVGRTLNREEDEPVDSQGLLDVVVDYTYALSTLDSYDYQRLSVSDTTAEAPFHATYEAAMQAIFAVKERFAESALFGNEKDESFRSSIGQIYQTFDGVELYPSVEEMAAMLLYLVTKNHSFSDGNKRIAATLFLWFLNNNHILYREDGSKRIADGTLVALTLMIAESRPEEKDVMVKVVVNLINKNNQ